MARICCFILLLIYAATASIHGQVDKCVPLDLDPLDSDGVSHSKIAVEMVFPVVGNAPWSDTFLAPRGGGKRRHLGQDVMVPKMTPLVAVFDGMVILRSSRNHNMLHLIGDNGWTAIYMHINNDTPGTDDGRGSDKYAFAPGLKSGSVVKAGQLVAYVGDSGNAEWVCPHLHFELRATGSRAVINPAPSLEVAIRLDQPIEPNDESIDDHSVFTITEGGTRIGRSEIYIEGAIRAVDLPKKSVTLEVTACTMSDGKRTPLSPARLKTVQISANTRLRLDTDNETEMTPDCLQVGCLVSVVGRNFGVGSVLPAREIMLHMITIEPAVESPQQATGANATPQS